MADSAMLSTWGSIIPGREAMSLGVFQEALTFWEGKKKAGEIEDVRVGLAANGFFSRIAGYILVEGSKTGLDKIEASQEYQRILTKAVHVANDLSAIRLATGTAIAADIELGQSVRSELGIV